MTPEQLEASAAEVVNQYGCTLEKARSVVRLAAIEIAIEQAQKITDSAKRVAALKRVKNYVASFTTPKEK